LAANTLFLAHDQAGALTRLGHIPEDMPKRLEREPKNPRLWIFEAMAEMTEGHPEEAVHAAERAVELVPASLDALDAPIYECLRARVYDNTGNKERALAEYARLLRTPGAAEFLNVYELKRDAVTSLHGDPRFQALLDDPANNAPLF
jgi:tetratricopeptide (TPR) repeat protein